MQVSSPAILRASRARPEGMSDLQRPGHPSFGVGTQKVEDTVKRLFSKARVARMDADAMSRKNTLQQTLQAFKEGAIDILVGTQMIAKGLHFPSVTLVGIINADLSLHLPDFRAGERTFQLLTRSQVVRDAGTSKARCSCKHLRRSAHPFSLRVTTTLTVLRNRSSNFASALVSRHLHAWF